MSDHHCEPTHPKARKEHRCIYCGGPILVGEQYVQQTGFYDGGPYRNRYHNECYSDCSEECSYYGEWEFTPHSADYPPRVRAIVDARDAVKKEPRIECGATGGPGPGEETTAMDRHMI